MKLILSFVILSEALYRTCHVPYVVLWWYGGIPDDEGSPPASPDGSRPLTPERSDGEQAASGGRGPCVSKLIVPWGPACRFTRR